MNVPVRSEIPISMIDKRLYILRRTMSQAVDNLLMNGELSAKGTYFKVLEDIEDREYSDALALYNKIDDKIKGLGIAKGKAEFENVRMELRNTETEQFSGRDILTFYVSFDKVTTTNTVA